MDEFSEQFQTVRKQMHLRRVKADKMSDILSKKQVVSVISELSEFYKVTMSKPNAEKNGTKKK